MITPTGEKSKSMLLIQWPSTDCNALHAVQTVLADNTVRSSMTHGDHKNVKGGTIM